MTATRRRLPEREEIAAWPRSGPAGLLLDVDAYDLLAARRLPVAALPHDLGTDPRLPARPALADLSDEARYRIWERFRAALDPLRAAGTLGAVVFRYGPALRPGDAGEAKLATLAERLPNDRLAVELTRAWRTAAARDRTVPVLRAGGLTLVDRLVADHDPRRQYAFEVTSDRLALLRLRPHRAGGPRRARLDEPPWPFGPGVRPAWLVGVQRLNDRVDEVHLVVDAPPLDAVVAVARLWDALRA